jgi:hypothetical protein
MGVENVFAIAFTLCLLVGFVLMAAFLSPRFGHWMGRHGSRISPRIGRLFRDGLGGGDAEG